MSSPPANYPPAQHILRDLAITTELVAADRVQASAPLDPGVCSVRGHATLGFMVAVADVSAALVALSAAQPDWIATADLAVHATGWITEGPLRFDAHLLRRGSKLLTIAGELSGGDGVPAAVLTATFARIPRSASAAAAGTGTDDLIGKRRMMEQLGPPRPGPLAERIELAVVDAAAGVVELKNHDYVVNSFGTINGGVLGIVFQTAAEAAVPELVATDIQIHYLRQTEVGPARTRTTVLRRGRDHAVCRIDAVDAGAGDRLLARAVVTLQQPPDA